MKTRLEKMSKQGKRPTAMKILGKIEAKRTVEPLEAREVLNVGEVAVVLRMKPTAIYNGVKNGVIPALKIGNRLRFSKRAVLEALNVRQTPQKGRVKK